MSICFVEFICPRSSSKFLWQWNVHWATPVLPHTKLLWQRATFMTSQKTVFVNPFVTSQRALSDNPIDDVTDSTVLNARQPRSTTSGAASSIGHYGICWGRHPTCGSGLLYCWHKSSHDSQEYDCLFCQFQLGDEPSLRYFASLWSVLKGKIERHHWEG